MNTTDSLIRYWQSPHLPGVELSHSHHRAFSYGRHVHLDYHIGLVQRGGQKFIHKGNSHHLVRGVPAHIKNRYKRMVQQAIVASGKEGLVKQCPWDLDN